MRYFGLFFYLRSPIWRHFRSTAKLPGQANDRKLRSPSDFWLLAGPSLRASSRYVQFSIRLGRPLAYIPTTFHASGLFPSYVLEPPFGGVCVHNRLHRMTVSQYWSVLAHWLTYRNGSIPTQVLAAYSWNTLSGCDVPGYL
jgi:hypothetical protein